MAEPKGNPAGALVFLFVALMGVGLFVLLEFGAEAIPPETSLTRITSGLEDVSYVGGKQEDFHFRLQDQPLGFSVPPQCGDLEFLSEQLESATGPVTILYDASDRRHPVFASEDKDFYLVYALERGGDQIFSYGQARAGYEEDRRFGLWVAPLFLLAAAYMCDFAYRIWKPAVKRHSDSP